MSGRFVVRMPPALHAELAERAAREGVSLNALVVALLAGGVGFSLAEQRPSKHRERWPPDEHAR